MPVLLLIGLFLIVTAQIMVHKNSSEFQKLRLASSMAYGEVLPLWGGEASGTLTLGNTLLSEDGKTLAVEIKYDDQAHRTLSSFGDRYRLRLVDTEDNRMDVDMAYGLFGTDGSGVLTVYSEKGFTDRAFIVMIIDNGQLVTSEDLQTNRVMSDTDINASITAQLSAMNSGNQDEVDEIKRRMPPLYYVRLNAHSCRKAERDWESDRDVVEDLFVTNSVKQLIQSKESLEGRIKEGQATIEEMEERLVENPDDNLAKSNISDLENTLLGLEKQVQTAEDNIEIIESSTIKSDVLSPKQEEYEYFTVIDLNRIK